MRTLRDYVEQTWGWERVWQEENFRQQFDIAGLEILEMDGQPFGTFSVIEESEALYLRNIGIHPDWQGRGLGSAMVRELLALARSRGLTARLQVLKVNPARQLYERLGFHLTAETETHFQMACAAAE